MSFRSLFKSVCLVLVLSLAPVAAHAQAATSGLATVKGSVADPDAAVIPGATVTLVRSGGKAIVAKSGSDGSYSLTDVPPGTYSLTITMSGFASFVRQGVKIAPGQALVLNAKLAIQDATTEVDVTAQAATLSIDADSNASSTIISGKDLDALSDDPDELSNELSALAGPAAGPNGGQIYIDGFTGGQLPPKSSIREIRVNQNPFSAQYDKPGFGRVEIFTKPGTDKFHGNAQINGLDSALNTGSPYASKVASQPPYHTLLFNGSLSGPINKNSSFTFGGQYRGIQDNTIIDPAEFYGNAAGPCLPGALGCTSSTTYGGYSSATPVPQTRYDLSPRFDLALGAKNTMTARYRYEHDERDNQGIDNTQLPDNAYTSIQNENSVQISDNQTVTDRIINEIHFEWQREVTGQTPVKTTPQVTVQGGFTFGGAPTGTVSDTQNHFEFQNYTSIALAKNFIRVGGRLRATLDQNTSTSGQNGSFTYTNLCNYTGSAAVPSCAPTTPAGPVLSQFTVTQVINPTVSTNTIDAGLYAEDDWKARKNLTMSFGVRFETQNYIHDHADFAPRFSFAWGLFSRKGNPKVVLRGGYGLFYDRLQLSNQVAIGRNNGSNSIPFTVSSKTQTISAACAPTANPYSSTTFATYQANCGLTSKSATTQNIQSNYHSPYLMQTNIGTDLQPFKNATLSINYQNIRGIHQLLDNNQNYTPTGATAIQDVYLSEGFYQQNQIIANMNYRAGRATIFGYYVLNYAKSDTSGASSFPTHPTNIGADYGRASFDIRNRVFMGGNITLPHLISLSPLLVASSGAPTNIVTGADNNGDLIFNDRPEFYNPATMSQYANYARSFGGRCGTFIDPANAGVTGGNYTEIPVNYCTGPANFTFNLRVAKTIGFGGPLNKNAANAAQNGGGGGDGGGPPGGGRQGGGGFAGGGGGGRGGGGMAMGGGGGSRSTQRYNLTLSVQGLNVFNVVDRGAPISTLSSPSFGLPSAQLAGQIYTTGDAVRRIQLQASFSF